MIRTLLRIWWGFLQKQLTTYYFHKKVSIIDIWHTSLMFFKKYWKIRWKTPVLEPFFNKVETRAQVLYCEFWELCKNTFLVEHLRSLPLSIYLWTTKIVFAITIQKTIHYTWVIIFSIDPGLVSHCLSYSEVYFTIIFYYVEQTPPDVQWRNREKRKYQEHEREALFHLAEFLGFLFCFWENFLFFS